MKFWHTTLHKKILEVILVISVVVFIVGIFETFQGNFNEVVWVLCPMGIFVWGDAIILGPFLAVSSLLLWLKNKSNISGMFFSLYAGIRAFIEVLYNLNAQFSTTSRPWDPYWQDTRMTRFFGVIETNVLAQVLFSVVLIAAVFCFIIFLKEYLKEELHSSSSKS